MLEGNTQIANESNPIEVFESDREMQKDFGLAAALLHTLGRYKNRDGSKNDWLPLDYFMMDYPTLETFNQMIDSTYDELKQISLTVDSATKDKIMYELERESQNRERLARLGEKLYSQDSVYKSLLERTDHRKIPEKKVSTQETLTSNPALEVALLHLCYQDAPLSDEMKANDMLNKLPAVFILLLISFFSYQIVLGFSISDFLQSFQRPSAKAPGRVLEFGGKTFTFPPLTQKVQYVPPSNTQARTQDLYTNPATSREIMELQLCNAPNVDKNKCASVAAQVSRDNLEFERGEKNKQEIRDQIGNLNATDAKKSFDSLECDKIAEYQLSGNPKYSMEKNQRNFKYVFPRRETSFKCSELDKHIGSTKDNSSQVDFIVEEYFGCATKSNTTKVPELCFGARKPAVRVAYLMQRGDKRYFIYSDPRNQDTGSLRLKKGECILQSPDLAKGFYKKDVFMGCDEWKGDSQQCDPDKSKIKKLSQFKDVIDAYEYINEKPLESAGKNNCVKKTRP